VSEFFDYNLTEVSEDKRVRRTETLGPRNFPEVVGADMRVAGGLKLFPGFRLVRRLSGFNLTSSNDYEVKEIQAFSVIGGVSERVHGWVYRKSNGTTSQWHLEYYNPQGSDWNTGQLESFNPANSDASQWSIVVVGRLLFLFIRGREPIRWYIDPDDSSLDTTILSSDTGPGGAPQAPTSRMRFNSWERLYNGGEGNERVITEFPYADPTSHGGPGGWDEDAVVNFDPRDNLKPGNYLFAVQYENTETGLKSNLSDILAIGDQEFVERIPFDVLELEDEDGNPIREVTYKSIGVPQEIQVMIPRLSGFDRVSLYRSVAIQGLGINVASSILYRDQVLEDFTSAQTITDFLSDQALVVQDTFDQSILYDANMPKGGIATEFDGALFVSSVGSTAVDGFRDIGEIRYSSFSEVSPELFPPGNSYIPKKAQDPIICWFNVASTLHGASKSRQIEVTKAGRYAVFLPLHEGYGAVSQYAACEFGPSAILVTPQGVKELRNRGEMLNINAFDSLIKEPAQWASTLGNISVVYDPPMGCIFMFNSSRGEAACLWTETRQVSEIWKMPFVHACEGVEPGSSSTIQRALFVTKQGAVYTPDYLEEKTFSNHPDSSKNGETYKTTLEIDGEHFFVVTSASGTQVTATAASTGAFTLTDCRDAWIYFPTQDAWRQVSYHTHPDGTSITFNLTENIPAGLSASDRLVLDPVQFRVMGYPLSVPIQRDGRVFLQPTRFSQRTAATIGCLFEGVSGAGLDQVEATFRGRIYLGLDGEQKALATPVDSAGNALSALGSSGGVSAFAKFDTFGVKDQVILPVVEVACSDIDFVLLSFRVSGSMNKSSTNVRT
jgi:hypothetical protein